MSTTSSPASSSIFARALYGGGCLRAAIGLGLALVVLGLGISLFTNESGRWTAVNMGLSTPLHPLALAMAPNQSTLFAVGSEQGQVLISSDGGSHWHMSQRGFAGAVSAVAFVGTRLVVGTSVGVFFSADSGQTWSSGTGIPSGTMVDALATLPDGTLLAGTVGQSIWRSRDGGATWMPSQVGLPASADITVIAALPDGTQVFAAASSIGVVQSSDDGQSWARSGSGLPDAIHFSTSAFVLLIVV